MAGGLSDRFTVAEARVGRVLIAFMGVGFGALIAAAIAIAWITTRNQTYTDSVLHTQAVRQSISEFQVALEQSETARRGYLLTGQPQFRDIYRRNLATFGPSLAALNKLTRDNAAQQTRHAKVRAQLLRLNALRDRSLALVVAGRLAAAQRTFERDGSVQVMRAIRARLGAMTTQEDALLVQRADRQRGARILFYAALAGTALLLAIVATISLLVVTRSTQSLTRSRDDLRALSGSLEDQVAERTADLSRANEEIQRFAYIVSHDLRSPLVNVMGFTAELEAAATELRALVDRAEETAPEILTQDMRLAAREDLPEAIGFIRTSTQKMDRLINAILTLARQGRRVLTPEPVDVAGIVAGIRDSFAHRLEEQGTTIAIDGELPAIVSDRLGIEQILSNLIENAVKYLQPGRPGRIVVTGGRDRSRLWYAVSDNGRGIDPRDHQRVFDLFRRSGQQDQPGEGIGLAHVRALAYRLGGTIDVASTLGEGATFRLLLPPFLDLQEPRA